MGNSSYDRVESVDEEDGEVSVHRLKGVSSLSE